MEGRKKRYFLERMIAILLIAALCIPGNISAATVGLNKSSIVLSKKSTENLKLSGTTENVTWSSSDKTVATVSDSGKVTAKKPGTAKIIATVGGYQYKCKVTVPNKKYTICKGNTLTVGKTGLKGKIKWSSSAKSCVKVSSKGKIKAVKAGKAMITAKAGKKVYRVYVVVQKAKLNVKKKNINRNETVKLTVLNNKKSVKWTSKNKKIAKVDSSGNVTGVSAGKTTITAKIKQGTLSCTITVKKTIHKHNFTANVKQEATCGQQGITEYKCSGCSKTYKEYTDAKSHDFEKTVVAPTCSERGYTKYVCKNDKTHSYVADYVKASGHVWNKGIVTKEASAEQSGEREYSCTVCGETKTETILWEESEHKLKTDKEEYEEGEDIVVSAQGEEGAWVGIYSETDGADASSPIYWYNVVDENHSSGENYVIQDQTIGNRSEITLPAGKYKVILYKDASKDVEDYCYITIKDNGEEKLKLNKTVYGAGERVMVTVKGSESAWVGVYEQNDLPDVSAGGVESIYWYYVAQDGHASGKAYAINKVGTYNSSRSAYKNLPAGSYKVILFSGDDYEIVTQKEFTVEGDGNPIAPVSVTYQLKDGTTGLADGTVTVTLSESDTASSDIVMYWADDEGPLEDYTSLAQYQVEGTVTKCEMYENTIIPSGATRLLVYTKNDFGVSESYAEAELPEGCNYSVENKEILTEFEMVSDVHITDRTMSESDTNYYNNTHFKEMLEDVAANSPNSQGIFINGDIADTGKESEYQKMQEIVSSMTGVPQIYMSVGNHDLSANNYQTQADLFIKYANTGTDTVYYDKTINGYHYIFMGSEAQGLRAELSQEQLTWLDKLLEEDTAKDPEKPVFVLLHQSLYNTVAGSLPGQNWDGAGAEGTTQASKLRAILKKYPQVLMFNGHSHWELNSEKCMYARDEELPNIFNTAAVGYLWSGYDILTGEYITGSQGYVVRVYEDEVMVLGRDFESGKYVPSAMFVAENYEQ